MNENKFLHSISAKPVSTKPVSAKPVLAKPTSVKRILIITATAILLLTILLTTFLTISSCVKISAYDTEYAQITVNELSEKEFDLIIIPGQGVYDGKLQEETAENGIDIHARLNYSIKLFQKQKEKPKLLLSGYSDRDYVDAKNIEAEVMYKVIAPQISALGYNPAEFIILEKQSHQTVENALLSKELIKDLISKRTNTILVLAPAKAYKRMNLVFTETFEDYNVTVASLIEQSEARKEREKWITFGTGIILSLPFDSLKLKIAQALPKDELKEILMKKESS